MNHHNFIFAAAAILAMASVPITAATTAPPRRREPMDMQARAGNTGKRIAQWKAERRCRA